MRSYSVCPLLSLALSLSLPSGIHDNSNEDKLFFLLINILTCRGWQAGSTRQELGWTGFVCVCEFICVCVFVCDSLVISTVPRQRSESARDAPSSRSPSRLCVARPLLSPPLHPSAFSTHTPPCSQHPLLPASSAHPEEEGWALPSCLPGNADMDRLASLHLEQSPSSTFCSPPSLFLLSFLSPFLCCLNYAPSQSRK